MNNSKDLGGIIHQKILSANQLLAGDSISLASFENLRTILLGLNPEIDKKLEVCSKAFSKLQKVRNGDIILLSADMLPEGSEKDKKRKKILLLFIDSLRNLKSEINRVDAELNNSENNNPVNRVKATGRIIRLAKGPWGIITIAAVIVVAGYLIFINSKQGILPVNTKLSVQGIVYHGKTVLLSQFFVGHGADCDSPHYHALNEISVQAIDGTVFPDPGGCGYGKVTDVPVITISR